MNWIEAAWHFLISLAGIDILIGAACVAVAVLEPPIVAVLIPDLRKWSIAGAVVAFTCAGLIAHGYRNGLDEKQRQWDAALARETADGNKARSDAAASVGPVPAERWMFRSDPDNRDSGKGSGEPGGALRGLDPYHLFRR